MEILNYTGSPIGLATESGLPVMGLPASGNAKCDIKKQKVRTDQRISFFKKVYGRVQGLPQQDMNLQTLYIVNKDIVEAIGHTRHDLLIVDELINIEGTNYYKQLVNV
jgi:hypothetical protein